MSAFGGKADIALSSAPIKHSALLWGIAVRVRAMIAALRGKSAPAPKERPSNLPSRRPA
jgi:hypothetical protein